MESVHVQPTRDAGAGRSIPGDLSVRHIAQSPDLPDVDASSTKLRPRALVLYDASSLALVVRQAQLVRSLAIVATVNTTSDMRLVLHGLCMHADVNALLLARIRSCWYGILRCLITGTYAPVYACGRFDETAALHRARTRVPPGPSDERTIVDILQSLAPACLLDDATRGEIIARFLCAHVLQDRCSDAGTQMIAADVRADSEAGSSGSVNPAAGNTLVAQPNQVLPDLIIPLIIRTRPRRARRLARGHTTNT